jgi:hypothetical protein
MLKKIIKIVHSFKGLLRQNRSFFVNSVSIEEPGVALLCKTYFDRKVFGSLENA